MSLHKLAHLSIPKMFWVWLKFLRILKNLSTLKTNFEEADGLGITEFSSRIEEFTVCFENDMINRK